MRMVKDLVEVLDDIEREDDWAAQFVADIAERIDRNPGYKLSSKQFEKLNQIHQRFVYHW